MIKQTKKNQKPIDYDVHLKYRCPSCDNYRWLSLLEASTKNFKVVCDCGCIFGVKRVRKFKLHYYSKSTNQPQPSNAASQPVDNKPAIPAYLLEQCVKVLIGYGFTKKEASTMIEKAYESTSSNDIGLLIKTSLENMKNVQQ